MNMTRKQISAAEQTLPPYRERSAEQVTLAKELRCRNMINSLMIYGNINSPYNEQTKEFNFYLHDYVSGDEFSFLGTKRVLELVREQQEDFKKAKVKNNVYVDCEGCSYNSCTWADD